MAQDVDHQFWYNMRTGEVEQGFVSPAPDRVGPFQTRAEAERALAQALAALAAAAGAIAERRQATAAKLCQYKSAQSAEFEPVDIEV